MTARATRLEVALNGVCPYFTMFPLRFPLDVLSARAEAGDCVFDPFCGRGTTNFAARLLGLPTVGIDVSPVAVALTEAKLAAPIGGPSEIVEEARRILRRPPSFDVPQGEFWSLAYRPRILESLCVLRAALLNDCSSASRKALRGIVLGTLHGPLRKGGGSSYFSNQSPRTFSPKPRYAVAFWSDRGLVPPEVCVEKLILERAVRYYAEAPRSVANRIGQGDSRDVRVIRSACGRWRPRWIVTSPPFYGLRTYVPDQWIRAWFLGGPPHVDYSYGGQVSHRSLEAFVSDLEKTWQNVASVAADDAKLIVRFGAINDRRVDPREILKESLKKTPWRLSTIVPAGAASSGRRQSRTFSGAQKRAIGEIDAWAVRA